MQDRYTHSLATDYLSLFEDLSLAFRMTKNFGIYGANIDKDSG